MVRITRASPSAPGFLAIGFMVIGLSGCVRGSGGAAEPSPMAPGEHRALIDGIEIAYHVAGSGPVLVAHPGGPGAEWSYLQMPEVEKHFTVVYVEPVGTGASGKLAKLTDYTMSRYVSDLEGLRAHLGLERFLLLGHSHGGFVALSYALAHPDRLLGLVLYDTTPTSGDDWRKDVEGNLAWFANEPWFKEAKAALAEETSSNTDEQITATFHREAPLYFADYTTRRQEFQPLIDRMRFFVDPIQALSDSSGPSQAGVAPAFEVRSELPRIQVPTLIIVGRKDFVCSLKMSETLRDGIPGSQMVVLEHSGHMGHIEEPTTFAATLAGFKPSGQR